MQGISEASQGGLLAPSNEVEEAAVQQLLQQLRQDPLTEPLILRMLKEQNQTPDQPPSVRRPVHLSPPAFGQPEVRSPNTYGTP